MKHIHFLPRYWLAYLASIRFCGCQAWAHHKVNNLMLWFFTVTWPATHFHVWYKLHLWNWKWQFNVLYSKLVLLRQIDFIIKWGSTEHTCNWVHDHENISENLQQPPTLHPQTWFPRFQLCMIHKSHCGAHDSSLLKCQQEAEWEEADGENDLLSSPLPLLLHFFFLPSCYNVAVRGVAHSSPQVFSIAQAGRGPSPLIHWQTLHPLHPQEFLALYLFQPYLPCELDSKFKHNGPKEATNWIGEDKVWWQRCLKHGWQAGETKGNCTTPLLLDVS